MNIIKLVVLVFASFIAFSANAALDIEITGGSAQQIPIAIVPFGNGNSMKTNVADIINSDLRRSGLFRLLDASGLPNKPTNASQVNFSEWTALQTQAVVVGNVSPIAGGKFKVSFQLLDVLKQAKLADMDFQLSPKHARMTAHKIADVIYQKLTGQPGAFASRIAYVTKKGPVIFYT